MRNAAAWKKTSSPTTPCAQTAEGIRPSAIPAITAISLSLADTAQHPLRRTRYRKVIDARPLPEEQHALDVQFFFPRQLHTELSANAAADQGNFVRVRVDSSAELELVVVRELVGVPEQQVPARHVG